MTESSQTTMVLGAAARDAGAVCDQIPTTTLDVGYVCQDGTGEPVRAFRQVIWPQGRHEFWPHLV